jgi:predicted DNA-binding protein
MSVKSFRLTKEQIKFIENLKWKKKKSQSEIMREIISHLKENPQKLEEIIPTPKTE